MQLPAEFVGYGEEVLFAFCHGRVDLLFLCRMYASQCGAEEAVQVVEMFACRFEVEHLAYRFGVELFF